jgi:hypothetical protein
MGHLTIHCSGRGTRRRASDFTRWAARDVVAAFCAASFVEPIQYGFRIPGTPYLILDFGVAPPSSRHVAGQSQAGNLWEVQALLARLRQRWAAYSTGRSQGEKRAISRNEYGVLTFPPGSWRDILTRMGSYTEQATHSYALQ